VRALSAFAEELPEPATLAATGLVLLASGVALAPVTTYVVRRIFPGRNVVFVRWAFRDVALAVVAVLLGAFLVGALWRLPEEPPIVPLLFAQLLALLPACAYAVRAASRRDPLGARSLGLWPSRNGRAVLAGVVAYAASAPALLGVAILWPALLDLLGIEHSMQVQLRGITEARGAELWAAAALAVLALPLAEELLFRAFLQPLIVQNSNEWIGVAITSLAFAAVHETGAFLPVYALSVLLGAIMVRTQRLAAAWAVHALHNGLAIALHGPAARELIDSAGRWAGP
jgi:membrane protease YdiL (CAAX protease family)